MKIKIIDTYKGKISWLDVIKVKSNLFILYKLTFKV